MAISTRCTNWKRWEDSFAHAVVLVCGAARLGSPFFSNVIFLHRKLQQVNTGKLASQIRLPAVFSTTRFVQ